MGAILLALPVLTRLMKYHGSLFFLLMAILLPILAALIIRPNQFPMVLSP